MLIQIKNFIWDRRYWVRQISIAGIASALAWHVGNLVVYNGGLVAAIAAALSVRISMYKSVREGVGQIVGTAIGTTVALIGVELFHFGYVTIFMTVVLSSVAARALKLGEVATINVPVTALIVIGPGISENNAFRRLISTFIGASIAILLSYFSHPKTPSGRTVELLAIYGRRSANLLADMAEGVAGSLTNQESGKWLHRARHLVELIPNLRSQALEAKRSSRWLPNEDPQEAMRLYTRTVSTEHIMVQVRSISRNLFDLSIEGGIPERVRREVALALSTASYAVADKIENHDLIGIANDLREATASLRDSLMKQSQVIEHEKFVKLMAIVSNFDIIADSLDESAPAITEVSAPDEPAHQKIFIDAPAKSWFKRLLQR